MPAELEPGQRARYIEHNLRSITLTLEGKKERFTYMIHSPNRSNNRWVRVLIGPHNDTDFEYMGGILCDNRGFRVSPKSKIPADAPSAKAFLWFWAHQEDPRVSVYLTRSCLRCGGKLTTPESILRGMGAECASKTNR